MREIRDKIFSLRLTQTEYKALKEQADKKNQSVGGYIRDIILKQGGLDNGKVSE